MPGPWDKYASVTGQSAPPWEKYATAPDTQTSGPWDDYAGAQPEPGDAIPGLRGMGLPEMPDATPPGLRPGPEQSKWYEKPLLKVAEPLAAGVQRLVTLTPGESEFARLQRENSAETKKALGPDWQPPPAPTAPAKPKAEWQKAAVGAARGTGIVAESLTSPENVGIIAGTTALNLAGVAFPAIQPAVQAANVAIGTKFATDMLRNAVERSPQIWEAVKRGDTEAAAQGLVEIGLSLALARSIVKHGMENLRPTLSERMGVGPTKAPTVPREVRAQAEAQAQAPEKGFADSLLSATDDNLAALRATETNPMRRGLVAREIRARQKSGEWAPTPSAPPEPTTRNERRAAIEPEQAPTQVDFENAAWQSHERPWSALSPEEQTAVKTSVTTRWAEKPSDSTLIDPELDRIARSLGVSEYRSLSERDQRAVRELRDEGAAPANEEAPQTFIPEERAAPPTEQEAKPAGLTPATSETHPLIYGNDTEIPIPGERTRYRAVYVLRHPDDTVASHLSGNFEKNPAYPHENDRQYQTPLAAEKIIRNATNYSPDYLINTNPDAVNGPPITDPEGVVLGDNGRHLTQRRIQTDPAKVQAYRNYLVDQAPKFGIPREVARRAADQGYELQRMIVQDIRRPQDLITDLNKVPTEQLQASERAIAESRRVSPDTLGWMGERIASVGPEATMRQSLEGSSAHEWVNRLIDDGSFSPQDRSSLVNRDGTITPEAKTRIERLMVGRMFESAGELDRSSPELRDKLTRVVAPLSRLEGTGEWDIAPATREAVRLIEEARQRGHSISDLTAQKGLLEESEWSPEAVLIARKLQEKPTAVAKAFRQYANEAAMTEGGQGLLGMEAPSAAESLREAFGAQGQKGSTVSATERVALAPTFEITPEMRRSVINEGQPMFALGRGEAQSPITVDRVAKAFGSKVEVSQLDNGDFSARLRDGRHVIVQRDLDAIHVSSETLQRDYGRETREGEQAVGRYVRIDRNGVIQLAKRGGDAEILDHEVFHAAVDLVLTPHEKAQLLKKWGTEEAAAEAYSAWKPGTPAGTLFAKIAAYFRHLYDRLFRPHQETLRKIRSGEVWERGARAGEETTSERAALRAEPRPDQEREREGTILSPNVEESYKNIIRKSGLSELGKREYEQILSKHLAEVDPERRVVGFKEIERMAREVDPEGVMGRRPLRAGETLPPEVMNAAQDMSRSLQSEIGRISAEINMLPRSTPKGVIEGMENQLTRMFYDQHKLLGLMLPHRTQSGRNLAYLRMEAQQSFDAAYWLGRIRRQLNIPLDKPIPQEQQILSALAEGQLAEQRAIERVTELPQRAPQRKNTKPAVERRTIELNDEERFAQAKRRELKRIESEMQGRRLLQILNPEDRARLLEDPEVVAARERLHQWRRDNRPVKTSDERIAAAIRRERTRLSRQLEGEPVTASPEKLTEAERKTVLEDPEIQSLKDQLRSRIVRAREVERARIPTEEEKISKGKEKELAKIAQQTELAEKGLESSSPKPPSKWQLTPEQRYLVNIDPEVIAARKRFVEVARRTLKTSLGDAWLAFRRTNVLTALATHAKNFASNLTFLMQLEGEHAQAAAIDAVVSKLWDRPRTIRYDTVGVAKAVQAVATNSIAEMGEIMRHGVSDSALQQFDFRGEINTGFLPFDIYVKAISRSMIAADRPFKIYAITRSLAERMKLAGVTEPTPGMIMDAIYDGDYATFNNQNGINDAIQKINQKDAARFVVGNIMLFQRTPSNVVLRGLERTPIAAYSKATALYAEMKHAGWTPELGKKFAYAISRGNTGTALIGLGMWLAAHGLMSRAHPGPHQTGETRADTAASRLWNAVKIVGEWFQLSSVAPIGTLIATGGTLWHAAHAPEREGDTWLQRNARTVAGTVTGVLSTVADMPMVQGIHLLSDVINDPVNAGPQILSNFLGSLIPASAALRSVAMATDKSQRDTKARGFLDETRNRIQANLPGFRNMLPERVDPLGNVIPQDREAGFSAFRRLPALEDTDPLRKAIADEQLTIGEPQRKPHESEEAYRWRKRAIGAAKAFEARQLVRSGYYASLPGRKSAHTSDERSKALTDAMHQGAVSIGRYFDRGYTELSPAQQAQLARQAWESVR